MTRPRIVLVAGWGQTGEVFSALVERLEPDFSVVSTSVYELAEAWRGSHGDPSVPNSPTAPSLYARQLQHDYLTEPVDLLVGWSMGSMVSLEAARWFSATVARMLLIAPTATFCTRKDYTAGVPLENVERMIAGLETDREQTLRWFLRQAYRKSISDAAFERKVSAAMLLEPYPLRDGLKYLRDTDLRPLVQQVQQPSLLLHGKEDRVISPDAARYLQDHLPQVTLEVWDRGTHALCEQFPAQIASQIRGLLRG